VINSQTHKNLKSHSPSYARQAGTRRLAARVLTVVAGIALLAAASSASSPRESAASPELVIESTRRDFGEVFIGEELNQVFTFRNAGTAPLELTFKTLTARSSASWPGQLIGAASAGSPNAASNYLKPAALINRLAAPT
jgi:hypothetical protein